MKRIAIILVAASLAATLPLMSTHAATPRIWFSSRAVAIDSTVPLHGSNLEAGSFYTLVIAVPNSVHPRVESFLPTVVRVNARGGLSARVKIPVVTQCGTATLYATAAKSKHTVHTTITLTGCKASKKTSIPPPPPPGHRSKGKKP